MLLYRVQHTHFPVKYNTLCCRNCTHYAAEPVHILPPKSSSKLRIGLYNVTMLGQTYTFCCKIYTFIAENVQTYITTKILSKV